MRSIIILGMLLILSGCYYGSKTPLVEDDEAVFPIRGTLHASSYNPKSKKTFYVSLERRPDDYRLTMQEGGVSESEQFALRLFDVGLADRRGDGDYYGAQLAAEKAGDQSQFYMLLYKSNYVAGRLDVLDIPRDEARLRQWGVDFTGSAAGGIYLKDRASLDRLVEHALRTGSLKHVVRLEGNRGDFPISGYAYPVLMGAIYRDKTGERKATTFGAHLGIFVRALAEIDDPTCRQPLSRSETVALEVIAHANAARKVLKPWIDSHRSGNSGREQAARDGWKTGVEVNRDARATVAGARRDAAVFYSRHGCSSPIARRFFGGLGNFVTKG